MTAASVDLPATLAGVERARAFVREAVVAARFSEDHLFQIELIVAEICVNIARYGFPEGPGEMSLRIWDDATSVFIEFTDAGRPFDPRTAPAPTLERLMRGERKGGLGIYLARRLSDTFDYRRENGRNVVTISKKKPS